MGELVFTSLTKESMPVVRYRTRDLTRLAPGVARSMRRMEKILGRTDDMMIVRGVNVFPTQIEEQLLKIASLAGHYQIVLTRESRLDEMEVQVEARSADDLTHARDHGGAQLAKVIKDRIGISAKVSVLAPAQIERSMGKAKRVIDERPKA
jgi:phenylacetate-CoA ligase